MEAAGQRRDLAADALAGHDEKRIDELLGRDAGLAHEGAQPLAAAQPPRPLLREAHDPECTAPASRRLFIFVAEEELLGALLAAEQPAEAVEGAVVTGPLEADGAFIEPDV